MFNELVLLALFPNRVITWQPSIDIFSILAIFSNASVWIFKNICQYVIF